MKKFIICIVTLSVALFFQIGGVCASVAGTTQRKAIDDARYCAAIIDDRIEETFDLLISLSNTELLKNTDVSYREKSEALTKISKQFGYMMIRVLDADFNVYSETATSEDGISSNLAKRDYLQNLKNTLTPQVTDAFIAGADGETINFTVAVPITNDGVFTGALFAAIYETDFADILYENNSVLVGSKLQYMSGVGIDEVGTLLDTVFGDIWLWGSAAEDRLLEIKRETSYYGCFWGMSGANIEAIAYSKILNTEWNVVCRVTFADAIGEMPAMFAFMIISTLATAAMLVCAVIYRRRFFVELPPIEKPIDDDDEDDEF